MDVIKNLRTILSKERRGKGSHKDKGSFVASLDKTMDAIQHIEATSDTDDVQAIFEIIVDHLRHNDEGVDLTLFGQLLSLQYEFYVLNSNCDKDQVFFYQYVANNPREYFDAIVSKGAKPEVKLTFTMNLLTPVQHTLKELELFNRGVKILLKLHGMSVLESEEIRSSGISSLLLFCVEMAESKKSATNKIANWKKCLQVYDWHTKENLSKTDISKRLGVYDEEDKPNSIAPVREMLTEAERLMKSAKAGSFPL